MVDAVGYRNRRAIKVARKGLQAGRIPAEGEGGHEGRARVEPAAPVLRGDVARPLEVPGRQAGYPAGGDVRRRARRRRCGSARRGARTHPCGAGILETCDMARFAPTSLELAVMQKTYDEARRIIVELERTLQVTNPPHARWSCLLAFAANGVCAEPGAGLPAGEHALPAGKPRRGAQGVRDASRAGVRQRRAATTTSATSTTGRGTSAEAILYYERAAPADPADEDLRHNLSSRTSGSPTASSRPRGCSSGTPGKD